MSGGGGVELTRATVFIEGDTTNLDAALSRAVARTTAASTSMGVAGKTGGDALMNAYAAAYAPTTKLDGAIKSVAGRAEGAHGSFRKLERPLIGMASAAQAGSGHFLHLGAALAGFELGAPEIVGILAGMAAIGLVMEHGKAQAEEYAKAIDKSVAAADKLRTDRQFGGTFELLKMGADVRAHAASVREGVSSPGTFGGMSQFAQYVQAQGRLQALVADGITSGSEYIARQREVSNMYAKLAPTLQTLVDLGEDEAEIKRQVGIVEMDYKDQLRNLNLKLGVSGPGMAGGGGVNRAIDVDMVLAGLRNPGTGINGVAVSDRQTRETAFEPAVVEARLKRATDRVMSSEDKMADALTKLATHTGEVSADLRIATDSYGHILGAVGKNPNALIQPSFSANALRRTNLMPGMKGTIDQWKDWATTGHQFKEGAKDAFKDFKSLFDPKTIASTAVGGLLSGGLSTATTLVSKGLSSVLDKWMHGSDKLAAAIEHNTKALQASGDFLSQRVKGMGLAGDAKKTLDAVMDVLNRVYVGELSGSDKETNFRREVEKSLGLPSGQFIDWAKWSKALGIDTTTVNVDTLEQFAQALEKATVSVNKTAAAFNVPEIWNVALGRFRAAASIAAGLSTPSGAASVSGRSFVLTGNIVLPGVRNGQQFVEQLEDAVVRMAARGGAPVLRDATQGAL